MSHEVEKMFYVGETPWHGLGVKLPEAPTIDDAIKYAGLDWSVACEDLHRVANLGGFPSLGEKVTHRAVVRQDTGETLGIVGPKWTPLQNKAVFEFLRPFVEKSLINLETAGSLKNGAKVWALANLNVEGEVVKNDTVKAYLMISNGHDGTMTARIGFTPIRVVCNNTLEFALDSRTSHLLRFNHTQGIDLKISDLQTIMLDVAEDFNDNLELFKQLAGKQFNTQEATKYIIDTFYPNVENFGPRQSTNAKLLVEQIEKNVWQGRGSDIQGVRGSWWGLYNAVNEHLCYSDTNDERRVNSLLFGKSKETNKRALSLALKAVG